MVRITHSPNVRVVPRNTIEQALALYAIDARVMYGPLAGIGRPPCWGLAAHHTQMAWFWMAMAEIDGVVARELAARLEVVEPESEVPLHIFPGFRLDQP